MGIDFSKSFNDIFGLSKSAPKSKYRHGYLNNENIEHPFVNNRYSNPPKLKPMSSNNDIQFENPPENTRLERKKTNILSGDDLQIENAPVSRPIIQKRNTSQKQPFLNKSMVKENPEHNNSIQFVILNKNKNNKNNKNELLLEGPTEQEDAISQEYPKEKKDPAAKDKKNFANSTKKNLYTNQNKNIFSKKIYEELKNTILDDFKKITFIKDGNKQSNNIIRDRTLIKELSNFITMLNIALKYVTYKDVYAEISNECILKTIKTVINQMDDICKKINNDKKRYGAYGIQITQKNIALEEILDRFNSQGLNVYINNLAVDKVDQKFKYLFKKENKASVDGTKAPNAISWEDKIKKDIKDYIEFTERPNYNNQIINNKQITTINNKYINKIINNLTIMSEKLAIDFYTISSKTYTNDTYSTFDILVYYFWFIYSFYIIINTHKSNLNSNSNKMHYNKQRYLLSKAWSSIVFMYDNTPPYIELKKMVDTNKKEILSMWTKLKTEAELKNISTTFPNIDIEEYNTVFGENSKRNGKYLKGKSGKKGKYNKYNFTTHL